jgi:diguanylate cyclase (GGDEF)-like protein
MLWHGMVLRSLFVVLAAILGKRVAPLSDWLVRRAAQRLAPRFAEECERQWLADFHGLPPWLRLKSALSVLMSRGISMGRRRQTERSDVSVNSPPTTVVLAAICEDHSFDEPESNYDALTGMANRRSFQKRLTRLTAPFRPGRVGLSVVIVDIDNFKSINDQLGHLAGDVVLKELGRRLRRALRRCDHIGRFGGDEFAVAMPNTSPFKAREMAERLRFACEISLLASNASTFRLSASVGIASRTEGMRADDILSRAGAALHLAKSGGRNCVREFVPTG